MSKRAFDLGAELRKAGGPTVDTREQIEYIPLELIDPDPENFYSLDGLNELAGNIELVGLQQPLRVRDGEKGHVIVVSGHRRRAAIMLIQDGGSPMFDRGVPCIREKPEALPEMQELKLIFANSQTRVLSGAEISRQAERVTELLYKLQKQGVVFPGRMRDHVAEAVNTSKSRIGRLHAIRERLDKPLLKMFDAGKLNETVSYALSQQPLEMQRKICDTYVIKGKKIEYMPANHVTGYAKLSEKLNKQTCKINKGGLCINKDGILEKVFDGSDTYKPCKYGNSCCNGCSYWLQCAHRCPLLDEKAKAERAKRREERKDELAAEKAQKAADIRVIEQVWARYAQALAAAGQTDADFRRKLKRPGDEYNPFDMYMDKEKVDALLDYSSTDTKPSTPLPFRYSFKVDDYNYLCRFADALGVSLDYLFLRSDEPETAERLLNNLPTAAEDGPPRASAPTDAEPKWQTGKPPRAGRYLCKLDLGLNKPTEQSCEYKDGAWTAYGRSVADVGEVVGWWPLPDRG